MEKTPAQKRILEALKDRNAFTADLERVVIVAGYTYSKLMERSIHRKRGGLELDPDDVQLMTRSMRDVMDRLPAIMTELIVRDERIKELESQVAQMLVTGKRES